MSDPDPKLISRTESKVPQPLPPPPDGTILSIHYTANREIYVHTSLLFRDDPAFLVHCCKAMIRVLEKVSEDFTTQFGS